MKIAELSIERELSVVSTDKPNFHRIDIEYIAVLKAYSKKHIAKYLVSGLEVNLKQLSQSFIWEDQVSLQLDHVTSRLALQTTQLLRKVQDSRSGDQGKGAARRYVRREHPNDRLANQAVRNVLSVSQDNRCAVAKQAIPLLKQSLQDSPSKYQTHFNMAWLSLFFLSDCDQAEQHFSLAAMHARKNNHLFSLFALRHLAKAHYMKGDYHNAELVMSDVLNSTLHPDPEYQYEYARYLAANGEAKLSALYLEQAIEKLPIYYTQAAAEPDFENKGIISQLLETYKQQSVSYVREQTKRTWHESELSSLTLPEDMSTARVLQNTCEKHEKEIEQHPLVIVKKTQKQIDEKLLECSKEALLSELIDKEKHCMKKINYKRTSWKLINKSGGMLIHAASILLLATFFVLAAKYIMVSVGLGTVFYFEEVTGLAFIAVLSLGGIGFYLLQSQPFGVRKLFEKSMMFRDAMTVVHKM